MSNQPRKTVKVSIVLDRANYYLKHSPDENVRERDAIAALCEGLLHDANAYAGYNYLESAEVDYDAPRFTCKDETRRFYYLHRKLA